MSDTQTTTPSIAPALMAHQRSPVSRTRRASFAFMTMIGCWAAILAIAKFHFPVSSDISVKAIDTLGAVATFIGVAYIGGSMIDYSGMLSGIGARFGIKVPFLRQQPQPQPDNCDDQGSN